MYVSRQNSLNTHFFQKECCLLFGWGATKIRQNSPILSLSTILSPSFTLLKIFLILLIHVCCYFFHESCLLHVIIPMLVLYVWYTHLFVVLYVRAAFSILFGCVFWLFLKSFLTILRIIWVIYMLYKFFEL